MAQPLLLSTLYNCAKITVRECPFGTAFNELWTWSKTRKIIPERPEPQTIWSALSLSQFLEFKQPIARIFAFSLFPLIAKFGVYYNIGLGGGRLIFSAISFVQKAPREETAKDLEAGVIHLASAVYDFALLCLFNVQLTSHVPMVSIAASFTPIPAMALLIGLFPQKAEEKHLSIYAEPKKEEPPPANPPPPHLDPACLIQQIATALTHAIIPPEEKRGFVNRCKSLVSPLRVLLPWTWFSK